jgi:COP9 signalosome complex subunit 2
MQDYDFEYDEDDDAGMEDAAGDVENQYYKAKSRLYL